VTYLRLDVSHLSPQLNSALIPLVPCPSSPVLSSFTPLPLLLGVQEALLTGRASLLLAEATWGEKAADVSIDYYEYRYSTYDPIPSRQSIPHAEWPLPTPEVQQQFLFRPRRLVPLSPSLLCSQSVESASVSCEPYDSAAVAVPAKPVRGGSSHARFVECSGILAS
jgi:hypothetical protein